MQFSLWYKLRGGIHSVSFFCLIPTMAANAYGLRTSRDGYQRKKAFKRLLKSLSFCSEERIRTTDLRVMSPTSYLCSTSQCGCKCRQINQTTKNSVKFFLSIREMIKNYAC